MEMYLWLTKWIDKKNQENYLIMRAWLFFNPKCNKISFDVMIKTKTKLLFVQLNLNLTEEPSCIQLCKYVYLLKH